MLFADGLCFYKLLCIFIIGGAIGELAETIFCYVKGKTLMRRSSFLHLRISVLWGLAFVTASWLRYKVSSWNRIECIFLGMIFGAALEYGCSAFTETFMGTKFWDYSNMPFNIKGRINLKYSVYWGIAAMIWMKGIFAPLEYLIEQIPAETGYLLCNAMLLMIILDGTLSSLAMYRYAKRKSGNMARYRWEKYIDGQYPDCKMEKLFPNMKPAEKETQHICPEKDMLMSES